MINNDIAGHTFYHSHNIFIKGQREENENEPLTCEDIATAAEEILDEIEPGQMSKMDQEEFKVCFEKAATKIVLTNNRGPIEFVYIEKFTRTYSGDYDGAQNNYSKPVDGLKSELLELAHQTHSIFAVSIVPINPDILQPWYYKKCFLSAKLTPENAETIGKWFEFGVPSFSDTARSGCKTTNSRNVLTGQKPSEIYAGFYKPFSTFSSEVAGAQLDPDNLPLSVRKTYVFSQRELDESINSIEDQDLQNSIRKIIELFVNDLNAKGLGVTILQRQNNKFYFTKLQK